MRAAVAAIVSVLALGLVGCGSEEVASSQTSSAGLLKPGALVYWQTVSDPDAPQWRQAERLLRKFPDGDRWVTWLEHEALADKNVSWEQDIRPALGKVVELAAYHEPGGTYRWVALTNPDDPDKLLALARKLDEGSNEQPAAVRVVGDWVAVSDSQAAIDAALRGDGDESLADDEGFKSALQELPDDALSVVYVNLAGAVERFGADLGEGGQSSLDLLGLDGIEFAGAWASAKDSGAELAALVQGDSVDKLFGSGEPYSSKLVEKVPAEVIAFMSFKGEGVTERFHDLERDRLGRMFLSMLGQKYGIELNELVELLEGEVAFYVSRGAPAPDFTLLLDSDQPEEARRVAEKLGGAGGLGLSLRVATVDGLVAVSTSARAIDELDDPGVERLPSSEKFQRALSAAGVPSEYSGLAFVDPSQLSPNLGPLKSLVAYGTKDGDRAKALAFLEID